MVKNIKDPATVKIAALERAVLELMKNFDDTNIHGMVNCIIRGWIRNGLFTDEYRVLTQQAEAAAAAETAARRREHEAQYGKRIMPIPDTGTIIINTNSLFK